MHTFLAFQPVGTEFSAENVYVITTGAGAEGLGRQILSEFYPRDAMLARYVRSSCLPIRLSQTEGQTHDDGKYRASIASRG